MFTRTPIDDLEQAALHLGCAVRCVGNALLHVWRAIEAFWRSWLCRLLLSFALGATLIVLFGGCANASALLTKANPLNWGSGRAAKKEAKAEVKQSGIEDQAVHAAQVEVEKTGVALAAARVENPESRPVAVAERTNSNARALLNQREPLDVATAQAAIDTANGLLSAETTRRESAEKAQAKAESDIRTMATELATTRKELQALKARADAEAANNLELARTLNNERFMKWSAMGLSAALGLLTIAYRLNIGRLQTAAGEVLAHVQKTQGTEAADVARKIAGVVLHTGEQKGVFKVFSALTQK